MNIKIRVNEDSMGCLTLTPVRQSYIEQIKEYLKDFGIDSDGTVFLQSDYDIENFYNDCNARQRSLIRSGWGVIMLFNAWTFLTMIGWDANVGLELKK